MPGPTLIEKVVDRVAALTSERRRRERAGDRTVFEELRDLGALRGLERGRILEIGPKHGLDSTLLMTLDPTELVLLDLPEKEISEKPWLDALGPKARLVEGNLLYMEREAIDALGLFDVVWCAGVLYHNAEQLRLVARLHDLLKPGGTVLIETSTARSPRMSGYSGVEVHWPNRFRGTNTVTHLPTRAAVRAWMDMVGFVDIQQPDVYSWRLARQRTVLTGRRRADGDVSGTYYGGEYPLGRAS